MSTNIVRKQTPEERELAKKRIELAEFETILAQRELDLATLQVELNVFEGLYLRTVGMRYAELDAIEARIAELFAQWNPDDGSAKERATEARTRAEESAREADTSQYKLYDLDFTPSDRLKKLYREAAKRLHPDLATDERERLRRQKFMVQINLAYARGDESRLEAILREWDSSPESVSGEGVGAELIRIIRKIAQVEERIEQINAEMETLQQSELYQLREKVNEARTEGRDLLAEMAAAIDREIAQKRSVLDNLIARRSRP